MKIQQNVSNTVRGSKLVVGTKFTAKYRALVGSTGKVLVLPGYITHEDNSYPSKKNPIDITVKVGEDESVLSIKDPTAIHGVDSEEVQEGTVIEIIKIG